MTRITEHSEVKASKAEQLTSRFREFTEPVEQKMSRMVAVLTILVWLLNLVPFRRSTSAMGALRSFLFGRQQQRPQRPGYCFDNRPSVM
jgi:hypothetical protein